MQRIDACLHATTGASADRQATFTALAATYRGSADPVVQHMGGVMDRWVAGLFAGGDALALPDDNLDLERFFKQPKHHVRHIHGRAHAGVRLVQQGPTLVPVLDAHHDLAAPLAPTDLIPYWTAPIPASQHAAVRRGAVMTRARSPTERRALLDALERRYLDSG